MTTTAVVSSGHVIGPYVTALLEAAREHGLGLAELSRRLGKPANWLDPLPRQISVPDYLSLMAAGAELSPRFGLDIGLAVKPNTYPVLGYTAMSCANIAQVLQQVIRFESINHDLGRSQVLSEGKETEARQAKDEPVCYCWQANPVFVPDTGNPVYEQLVASVFSGLYNFSHYLVNEPVPLIRLEFAFPRPPQPEIYQQMFGCPVLFGQPRNALWIERAILDWPVSNADDIAFEALTQHARALLDEQKSLKQTTVVERVRRALLTMLRSQQSGIERVSEQLNMSARTLQRKLKEEGTSYQQELDNIRRELAQSYLEHSRLSISEIAFLLGYQEQSSFNHAFREWVGMSPTSYRQQLAGP